MYYVPSTCVVRPVWPPRQRMGHFKYTTWSHWVRACLCQSDASIDSIGPRQDRTGDDTEQSKPTPAAACDRIPTSVASNKQFTHSLVIRHELRPRRADSIGNVGTGRQRRCCRVPDAKMGLKGKLTSVWWKSWSTGRSNTTYVQPKPKSASAKEMAHSPVLLIIIQWEFLSNWGNDTVFLNLQSIFSNELTSS